MAGDHLLFGRNVLKEAILKKAKIREIFFESESAKKFAESISLPVKMKHGIPRQLSEQHHQGIAFNVVHDFYIRDFHPDPKKQPRILMCNHLEDVQNLGALARSAAAFGFDVIVHEDRRSVSLTAAAIKASAGQAFRIQFVEVTNLVPLIQTCKKLGYISAGLHLGDEAEVWDLYQWKVPEALVLVVGSEESGISKPVVNVIDDLIKIPMQKDVESLNAAQAATIAMSRVFAS